MPITDMICLKMLEKFANAGFILSVFLTYRVVEAILFSRLNSDLFFIPVE
jgi:hypothetical protein